MDIMINISLLMLILSVSLFVTEYLFKKNALSKFAIISYFISTFVFITAIFMYTVEAGRLPLSNQFESVMILCLGMFCVSIYFYFKYQKNEDIIFYSSIIISIFVSLLNLIEPSMKPLMPVLKSNWLFYHVLTSMFAYSFFALASIFSIFIFFKKDNSKLEKDIVLRMVRAGFAMLSIGIITGSVWAETAWGRYWSWDPKETWSLITWFYYAGFLHVSKKNLNDKKFSVLLIIGILIVIFTYFGVNYLMSGLHSYA